MLPPIKQFLTISQEDSLSILQSRFNGNFDALPQDKINEALQPYIESIFDIPEYIKLIGKTEKEFINLRRKPIVIMKKFLVWMGKINDILEPYKPCKKGCSHCCFIHVKVSNLEVVLIEEYLNKKKNTGYKRKEYTINEFLQKGTNAFFGNEYNGKKCPFLKNNECAIYFIRPYVCRRYIIFENDNTKCGYNSEEAVAQFMCGITETSYENIIKHYLMKNPMADTNNVMFGDIREYFVEG